MAFSYSGNPSDSQLDAVRFLIADTDAANPILQDAEITYIFTIYSNTTLAAAFAMEQIASRFSGKADITVGAVSQRFSGVADAYLSKAMQLRREATRSAAPSFPSVVEQDFKRGPSFYVGMADTPWASQINSDLTRALSETY